MTTLSLVEPTPLRPLGSLLASAQRLTSANIKRTVSGSRSGTRADQDDAWDMYGLVGEQRFLAVTLAGRLAQARLYVGEVDDPTEQPVPVDDPDLTSVLTAFGSSAPARSQLLFRLAVNLYVSGDGWLVGIPRHMLPASLLDDDSEPTGTAGLLDIQDLEWRMLSVSEVTTTAAESVTLYLGASENERITCKPEDVWLIRVWRPHPRYWWNADSPVLSSLPVLRELVGLSMRGSAEIDSRLAGAGLIILPQSVQRALRVAAGLSEDDDSDPFTEALIEAMVTPIQNRASASAVVPMVVTVPDEACDKIRHLTFSTPLDATADSRSDRAIRRLALQQDAPPELLLGMGGSSHWGAWLVQQDVVTTHIEPPLALICDALTTQYLWPVLRAQGMDRDQARKFVVWYDVSDLIVRPNHSQDAFALHQVGAIDDQALRAATGFDDSDAPATDSLPLHVVIALELVKASPALLAAPGFPQVAAQVKAVLDGDVPKVEPVSRGTVPPTEEEQVPAEGNPEQVDRVQVPETDGAPAEAPQVPVAASGFWETNPGLTLAALEGWDEGQRRRGGA
jgi:hypothetical protein